MKYKGYSAHIIYDNKATLFHGKAFSGKFNVRLSPQLHATLAKAAKSKGVNLNTSIQEKLRN